MKDRPTQDERFWSYVVKGPAAEDCWIWTGAVADDGYGRFWTAGTAGKQLTVRPQRYAYQLITGLVMPSTTMLLYRCDIPLCVHADLVPDRSHVRPGSGVENMEDRSRRGRHPNAHTTLGLRGLSRAERARKSRQLRDAFRTHGWDAHALHAILSGFDPANPPCGEPRPRHLQQKAARAGEHRTGGSVRALSSAGERERARGLPRVRVHALLTR